jgi:hypothetical protein
VPGDGRRRARLEDKGDCDVRQVRRWSPRAGAWVQDQIPGIEEPFIKPWMIDIADDQDRQRGNRSPRRDRASLLTGSAPVRTCGAEHVMYRLWVGCLADHGTSYVRV